MWSQTAQKSESQSTTFDVRVTLLLDVSVKNSSTVQVHLESGLKSMYIIWDAFSERKLADRRKNVEHNSL